MVAGKRGLGDNEISDLVQVGARCLQYFLHLQCWKHPQHGRIVCTDTFSSYLPPIRDGPAFPYLDLDYSRSLGTATSGV